MLRELPSCESLLISMGGNSFSAHAKFFEKLTFQGVKNVSFLENSAYALNE